VALGGRCAEEVVFGDFTTGAEGDIAQLTTLARYMVGRWGMNEKIGLVAVLPQDGASPFSIADGFSRSTRELMDAEVRRMVDEAHSEVLGLLSGERTRLDALAEALLAQETLDEDAAYAAARVERPREPSVN
jgi:cell division protease FtsH